MTPASHEHHALLRHELNRRRFLTMLGGAGALGAVSCASGPRTSGSRTPVSASTDNAAAATDADHLPAASVDEVQPRRPVDASRRLVVIEMSGGNDGLAMLQPFEAGVLRDGRTDLMSPDEELIDAGDGFGWHPGLARIAERGIAAVVGVGSTDPDFSHFAMEQRWWSGVSEPHTDVNTGFFGRLCDQLDVGDPVTGLSFSGGPSPALLSSKAVTVGLTHPGTGWFFNQDDPWFTALRQTFGAMAEPSTSDSERFAAARGGLANTLHFAESLSEIPENEREYPWSDLGQQLRFAADVLDLDVGVKVMHVRHGGFDTHKGQQWRHRDLMEQLNDALVAFTGDLEDRGHLDSTLIVTTSEFGRRVVENDSGTDHGGASTMMVCGGNAVGVHGEAPSLSKLDDDNLVATARFEDYYATIAEDWFGIAADEVLPTGGSPVSGLLA